MPGPATRTPTTRSARPRSGGPAQVLRGVLALALLLALVVGIPVALLAVGSTSYVGGLGDVPRLLGKLTAPDDGTLFLGVLAVAAWIGWFTFTLAVVLEIPAQFRGVPAVRLRGMSLQQSLAGGLVAAALALVVIPGSAGAAEAAVGRPVVATRSAVSPP